MCRVLAEKTLKRIKDSTEFTKLVRLYFRNIFECEYVLKNPRKGGFGNKTDSGVIFAFCKYTLVLIN